MLLHALARKPHRADPVPKAECPAARGADEGNGPLLAPKSRGLALDEVPEVAGVEVVAHDGPADLELA